MPDLENLKKQAKLILRWHREHHYPVAAQIRALLPRFGNMSDAKAYPDSANAWDSLGDGYEATNDVQDARAAYTRSVELNPTNEHAKGELVKLRK